jgi:hypothetical protein
MSANAKEQVLTEDERQVLAKICDDVGVPPSIVAAMIHAENAVYGMGRRHGIWEILETLITKGVTAESNEVKQ